MLQDISGNIKIDFKNPESARIFTRCCLLKDFNLDIVLPPDKLLPTIPLRLNYLLWMEDLLKHAGITEDITGVDIGCGASCIYCLLTVRMNETWKVFALEIDEDNIKFAEDNINRNQLSDNVTVIRQNDNLSVFGNLFDHDPRQKTFCICNPPFFSSSEEVVNSKNRTGKRKAPKSMNAGSPSELIFEDGGELGFVKRILNESISLKDQIQIYSTMFGCKKNFQKFIEEIKAQKIQSFSTTEFVQGKTTRWGVAWSFKHDLKSFHDYAKTAKTSSAVNILKHEILNSDFEKILKKLKEIFRDLKIEIKIIEELPGDCHRSELIATQNTWSNQRRKRRAESRQDNSLSKPTTATENQDLHLGFELKKLNEATQVQMFFISGTMSKDCTNQIMQFIKNKFN